jgi:hypothetical protein
MKSKERFLKVKEEDDSEKGCYWYLNPEGSNYAESIENAHETADKLDNFCGIVYYKLKDGEEPPAAPILFSDDDRTFTSELYAFDESSTTYVPFLKYAVHETNNSKKKSHQTTTSRVELPLPPPPFRNLIVRIKGDTNEGISTKSDKRKKALAQRRASKVEKVCLDDNGQQHDIPKISGQIEYGGLAMAYPTPRDSNSSDCSEDDHHAMQSSFYTDPADFGYGYEDNYFSNQLHSPQSFNYNVYHELTCHNPSQEVLSDVPLSPSAYKDLQPETPCATATLESFLPLSDDIFNEETDALSDYTPASLLFGSSRRKEFAVPVINVSRLDIESLINDPSVPIDEKTDLWDGLH